MMIDVFKFRLQIWLILVFRDIVVLYLELIMYGRPKTKK
jgi:hypothetical protein